MLRIFVVALLSANILLLGFELLKPDQPTGPASASVATKAAARPLPARNLPKIELMSEAMAARSGSEQLQRCFSLGPFEAGPVFDAMLARVGDDRGWVNVRESEAMVEQGYWVHLPPFADLADAYAASRRLKAAGVEDVAVLTEGEWHNTVSLGYFHLKEYAQRRRGEIESQGFEPRVLVRRELEPRYWLDYQPGAVSEDIRTLAGAQGIYDRSLPCPERPAPPQDIRIEDSPGIAPLTEEVGLTAGPAGP